MYYNTVSSFQKGELIWGETKEEFLRGLEKSLILKLDQRYPD